MPKHTRSQLVKRISPVGEMVLVSFFNVTYNYKNRFLFQFLGKMYLKNTKYVTTILNSLL